MVSQDVSEKARGMGLSNLILNNDSAYSIVRSCLAIPMVPKNSLMLALETVMTRAHNENLIDDLQDFFQYLHNEWVTKRKEVLSVFDSEDRTNNVAESWNSKFQSTQDQVHPNFYQCIGIV